MTKPKKAPKAKTAPSSTPTLVTFLLDRSGSMGVCRDSTIEAFNGYLDGLRDTPSLDITLVQFDQYATQMQLDKTFVAIPVKDAPKLTYETYQPRGSTPLIDAAYTVIKAVETSLLDKPKDTKVVVCIQTDGEENCSRTYNWEQLNTLIKEKQDLGWQFNFMGAGIDAYQQARKMGVGVGSTMSYDHMSPRATRSAFRASSAVTASFSSGLSANTSYSVGQKSAAGDKFDPALVQGLQQGALPPVLPATVAGISQVFDLSKGGETGGSPSKKEAFKL